MNRERLIDFLLLSATIIIASIILFNKLGGPPVADWDEARLGESAIEMLHSGDWIVTTYDGEPDLWSVKPPLAIWFIATSFTVFGINEFALRFWPALFGVGTVVLIYFFGRLLWSRFAGFFAALLLLTLNRFTADHSPRTGDYDSFVTFFIVLSLYLFCLYIRRRSGAYLTWSAVTIGFAVLAKSFVGLVPVVIIGIHVLRSRSWRQYCNKNTLQALGLFFLVVLPWFVLRLNRGVDFFQVVFSFDIIARMTRAVEGHVGDWLFHYWILEQNLGLVLFVLFHLCVFYALYRYFTQGGVQWLPVVWFLVIFTVLTIAKTKISSYMLPAYPAICLIMGGAVGESLEFIRFHLSKRTMRFIALVLFIMLILFRIVPAIAHSEITESDTNALKLKGIEKELKSLDVVYVNSTSQSQYFYVSSFVKQRAIVSSGIEELKPGEYLVTLDVPYATSLLNSSKVRQVAHNDSAYILQRI